MAHSFSRVLLHIVFATKYRQAFLTDEIREDLHAYIGGIIRTHAGTLIAVGSVEDHMHLLVVMPRTMSIADLVQQIKQGSSQWLRATFPALARFEWQAGYGVFSVSNSQRLRVKAYVLNQRDHHKRVDSTAEFTIMLRAHSLSTNDDT